MNIRTTLTTFTILAGLMASNYGVAEEHHNCHAHCTSTYELGFSVGYVHLDEKEEHHEEEEHEEHDEHEEMHETSDDGIGVHAHIGKRLGHDGILSHISLGIGGEIIIADHDHFALMGNASIYPWKGLVLGIGPGFEWAEHDGEWESEYSTHLELAYVFDMGGWHLGPSVDYSWTDHGEHFSAGIHCGIHL